MGLLAQNGRTSIWCLLDTLEIVRFYSHTTNVRFVLTYDWFRCAVCILQIAVLGVRLGVLLVAGRCYYVVCRSFMDLGGVHPPKWLKCRDFIEFMHSFVIFIWCLVVTNLPKSKTPLLILKAISIPDVDYTWIRTSEMKHSQGCINLLRQSSQMEFICCGKDPPS